MIVCVTHVYVELIIPTKYTDLKQQRLVVVIKGYVIMLPTRLRRFTYYIRKYIHQ